MVKTCSSWAIYARYLEENALCCLHSQLSLNTLTDTSNEQLSPISRSLALQQQISIQPSHLPSIPSPPPPRLIPTCRQRPSLLRTSVRRAIIHLHFIQPIHVHQQRHYRPTHSSPRGKPNSLRRQTSQFGSPTSIQRLHRTTPLATHFHSRPVRLAP